MDRSLSLLRRLYRVSITDTPCGAVIRAGDVYVLSGLALRGEGWTYRDLAADLHVPLPVVQRAVQRADSARLYLEHSRQVHRANFEEFAVHALRFVAPAKLGEIVPGIPAAWAAAPVDAAIRSSGNEPPPVWPSANGKVRGQALEPLHSSAPAAAADSASLSAFLAILDSLRAGDVRVRAVAADLLHDRLLSLPAKVP
jgi:hypothetical protein